MIRDQRERAANPSDDAEYPGSSRFGGVGVGGFFRRAETIPGGHEPSGSDGAPRTVPMRIEPKTFFANERTFLSWLHTAVPTGTHRRRTRVDSSREERGDTGPPAGASGMVRGGTRGRVFWGRRSAKVMAVAS